MTDSSIEGKVSSIQGEDSTIAGEVSIAKSTLIRTKITNRLTKLLDDNNIPISEDALEKTVEEMYQTYIKEKEIIPNISIENIYFNNLTPTERLRNFGSNVNRSFKNSLGVAKYYVKNAAESAGRVALNAGKFGVSAYKSGLFVGGKSRRRRIKKTTNKKKSNRRTHRK